MTDTPPDRPDRAAANERQRRYRQRLAGLLPPVPRCVDCGCRAMGADQDAREPRCRVCWRRTDQGREWNRTRMRAIRLANQIINEGAA